MTQPIEKLADAVLHAAGSGLHHYSIPATRQAILAATQAAFDAGHAAGWAEFGELMIEQFGPNAPKIEKAKP